MRHLRLARPQIAADALFERLPFDCQTPQDGITGSKSYIVCGPLRLLDCCSEPKLMPFPTRDELTAYKGSIRPGRIITWGSILVGIAMCVLGTFVLITGAGLLEGWGGRGSWHSDCWICAPVAFKHPRSELDKRGCGRAIHALWTDLRIQTREHSMARHRQNRNDAIRLLAHSIERWHTYILEQIL